MNTNNVPPPSRFASVYQNENITYILSLSGYWRSIPEDEPHQIFLPRTATVEDYGIAIIDAFSHSRFLNPGDHPEFFASERQHAIQKRFEADMLKYGGYKTVKRTFENMKWVSIYNRGGEILFSPHPAGYSKTVRIAPDIEPLTIRDTDNPTELGVALDIALSRCV